MNQPERPDLVLRIGFAGNRWGRSAEAAAGDNDLRPAPENKSALRATISDVFDEVEGQMLALTVDAAGNGRASRIVQFCSTKAPLLRLITGLAEGADQLAAEVLHDRTPRQGLTRELAAVLPCPVAAFRATRERWHWPDFDAEVARCAYVLELDGICDKPQPDTPMSKARRTRAYRAQSTFLLRQCDVLLAVVDLTSGGSAGGTLESITRAMAFQLPVIVIDSRTGHVHLLEPSDDLAEALDRSASVDWRETLRGWLSLLAAGPATESGASSGSVQMRAPHSRPSSDLFLDEFFAPTPLPPKNRRGTRRLTLRERLWNRFSDRFHSADSRCNPGAPNDRPLEPFATWRMRATELSYHYTGLYRGAFILNYALAVVAVTLATLSLVLIATLHASPDIGPIGGLAGALLALAFLKLVCIVTIFFNTHSANHSGWNDKAIDYRYLSERLRCAFYLPTVGSARPPVPAKAQFTSRVLRQSAVDWLFEAMTRHVSPFRIGDLHVTATADTPNGGANLLRVDSAASLQGIRAHWLAAQQDYHRRNKVHMDAMHHCSERLVGRLNLTVMFAVTLDLLILLFVFLSEQFGLPHWHLVETLHGYAPGLIFVAAVLPAAVASLNGVRFQSECRRLADRSGVMQKLLQGNAERATALAEQITRSQDDPATDLGSWSAEVLRLAEFCEGELVEEATEWSVLYAKEIHEP